MIEDEFTFFAFIKYAPLYNTCNINYTVFNPYITAVANALTNEPNIKGIPQMYSW